jgi:hypothetical protein
VRALDDPRREGRDSRRQASRPGRQPAWFVSDEYGQNRASSGVIGIVARPLAIVVSQPGRPRKLRFMPRGPRSVLPPTPNPGGDSHCTLWASAPKDSRPDEWREGEVVAPSDASSRIGALTIWVLRVAWTGGS